MKQRATVGEANREESTGGFWKQRSRTDQIKYMHWATGVANKLRDRVAQQELPSGAPCRRCVCHRSRGAKGGQRCLDELDELGSHGGMRGGVGMTQAVV